MPAACWVSRSGWSSPGQLLGLVPVVSSLEPGLKVADPPCLLGLEEGGSDAVPQAAGIGLQEDRGASHKLQGTSSQWGSCMWALGGQQRAAGGGEAQLPLEGVVGREEGALWRQLVEEEGDEAQDSVCSLQKGGKGRVSKHTPATPFLPPETDRCSWDWRGPTFPDIICKMGAKGTPASWGLRKVKQDQKSETGFLRKKKKSTIQSYFYYCYSLRRIFLRKPAHAYQHLLFAEPLVNTSDVLVHGISTIL